MRITSVELKNVRNIESLTLEPGENVNIIYGENAQGKTNLLEAIWMFSGLKSFRGAKDSELVRFGEEFARMKMDFFDDRRDNKAEIRITNRRSVKLNGVDFRSPTELFGKFSAVVFAPAFMDIIKDGPAERRRFIDAAICQIRPGYAGVLAEYKKQVEQRNNFIRNVPMTAMLCDLLDIVEDRISRAAERVYAERTEYLSVLSPFVTEIYSGLSDGKEEISLSYIKKDETEDGKTLAEVLRERRKTDAAAKSTTAGPHRDDIEININGVSARHFGSQGQQRSCAVALKLGEACVMEKEKNVYPVVLLDDVMSELDTGRQDYILNHIKDRQVFITCCEPSAVTRLCEGKTFRVANGAVREE